MLVKRERGNVRRGWGKNRGASERTDGVDVGEGESGNGGQPRRRGVEVRGQMERMLVLLVGMGMLCSLGDVGLRGVGMRVEVYMILAWVIRWYE